jgi:AraC-like DNA-binding protein
VEYRELPAASELAADVACVWYDDRLKSTAEVRTQLVMPDGCVDIVWMRGRELSIAGPATLPIQADLPPSATLVGVRFRTGRAPAFLGLPADALLNADVPLREVWGDGAQQLQADLEATSSTADALATLQTTVSAHRAAPADALVHAAITRLRRAPQSAVGELADALGLSERQLLRRFTASVGYGPRTLARVLRFRRFLALLSDPSARAWDLARLAAESGFADHAHLARECGALAGLTPSRLRQLY